MGKGSFSVSSREQVSLRAFAVHHQAEPALVRRAKVLLRRAKGGSLRSIQAQEGMSPWRIRHWQKRYRRGGLNGLCDAPRTGRKKKLNDELKARVWEATRESASDATSRLVAERVGLSRTSITRVWNEKGCRRSRGTSRRIFLQKLLQTATFLIARPKPIFEIFVGEPRSEPADLVELTRKAVDLHHRQNEDKKALIQLQQVLALAEQRRDWAVEKRSRLNIAYIEMGRGAPDAAWHFKDVADRALAKGDHVIATEAFLARGRIFQNYEDFERAEEEFAMAESYIPKGTEIPDKMPGFVNAAGHSLVIASDWTVEPEIMLTFLAHFRSKNSVLRGLLDQSPLHLQRGLAGLRTVSRVDKRSNAVTNLGFDLLFQVEPLLALDEPSSEEIARNRLNESEGIFSGKNGAGAGYTHLNRGIVAARDGEPWEEDFRLALDQFSKIALRNGVALVHRHYYEYLSVNRTDRHSQTRALDSALVCAALMPTGHSLDDLKHAASTLDGRDLRRRLTALQSFQGDTFAPVEGLIKRFGNGPMATEFDDALQKISKRLLPKSTQ